MSEILLEREFKECFSKGLKYIYPQYKREWAEAVKKSFEGANKGKEAQLAVKAIEALDAGQSERDVYFRILKNYEGHENLLNKVLALVAQFSKRGIGFFSWVAGSRQARVMTGNEEKFLSKLARLNEKFEKELSQSDLAVL